MIGPVAGVARSRHLPYRVEYMPTALGHLCGLTARERALVIDTVDEPWAHQPDVPTRNHKPMRPNPLAPWELRIGALRVFYDIGPPTEGHESTTATVAILAVGVKR